MAKKKGNQRDKRPIEQLTISAKPVELTDEELGQVVGGIAWGGPTKPGPMYITPNPTAVE